MKRVLLIDDSVFMAKALKKVLEELGFEVVGLAHDGLEGLEKFEQLRPDVTLLDVTMPNMDGVECLSNIRQLDRDARVVMLSAVHDEETVRTCMENGAAAFLHKPIRKGNEQDLERLRVALESPTPASSSS